MRFFIGALFFLFLTQSSQAQQSPEMLLGKWKLEEKSIYEIWTKESDLVYNGITYSLDVQKEKILEHLKIERGQGNSYRLIATVLDQNGGLPIVFTQEQNDTALVFANRTHDFPKKIVYRKIAGNKLQVRISDDAGKQFTSTYIKYEQDSTANPHYDEVLAKKLKADDFGMKLYYFVVLKTGTAKNLDQKTVGKHFEGHMANINKLVKEGSLVVAGPFSKNDKAYRGLFIFQNIENEDKLKSILISDPAIKSGLLDFEIYQWYGSAALPQYLPYSDKIWKRKP